MQLQRERSPATSTQARRCTSGPATTSHVRAVRRRSMEMLGEGGHVSKRARLARQDVKTPDDVDAVEEVSRKRRARRPPVSRSSSSPTMRVSNGTSCPAPRADRPFLENTGNFAWTPSASGNLRRGRSHPQLAVEEPLPYLPRVREGPLRMSRKLALEEILDMRRNCLRRPCACRLRARGLAATNTSTACSPATRTVASSLRNAGIEVVRCASGARRRACSAAATTSLQSRPSSWLQR